MKRCWTVFHYTDYYNYERENNLPSCSLGPVCWSDQSAQSLRVSHHPPQPRSEGRGSRPWAKRPGGITQLTGPHTASYKHKTHTHSQCNPTLSTTEALHSGHRKEAFNAPGQQGKCEYVWITYVLWGCSLWSLYGINATSSFTWSARWEITGHVTDWLVSYFGHKPSKSAGWLSLP